MIGFQNCGNSFLSFDYTWNSGSWLYTTTVEGQRTAVSASFCGLKTEYVIIFAVFCLKCDDHWRVFVVTRDCLMLERPSACTLPVTHVLLVQGRLFAQQASNLIGSLDNWFKSVHCHRTYLLTAPFPPFQNC